MADATAPSAYELFEAHRQQLLTSKRRNTIFAAIIFLICLSLAVWVSRFDPIEIWNGLPKLGEYLKQITPSLQWDVLFEPKNPESGRAVPGSLAYWYSDFWLYLWLIFQTILMAIAATLMGAMVAVGFSFMASSNLVSSSWVYFWARRFLEACRGIPEILLALVFVFLVGIGPLAGILAIAIHTTGALGKLFAEVNENASLKPVEGIAAVGGSWTERMLYGVLPQVTPNFVSYALLRFEINVRASSIIGFVGAGGIGQELQKALGFYQDDRVLAIIILIVITVTLIDLLSERLRIGYIGKENLK